MGPLLYNLIYYCENVTRQRKALTLEKVEKIMEIMEAKIFSKRDGAPLQNENFVELKNLKRD